MRRTISGETLKKEVYNRDFVDSFLKQTLADSLTFQLALIVYIRAQK